MNRFSHCYPFDPSYGYDLEDLLAVVPPSAPADFQVFWQQRYRQAMAHQPQYWLTPCGSHAGFKIYDIGFFSTCDFTVNGWLLVPEDQNVSRGVVVGHGYGGREQPDYHIHIPETVFLFPCFRGLSRSRRPGFPDQPDRHVLYALEQRDGYIIGGCVDDLWVAVSVLSVIYPQTIGNIGYMGISFGGGVGALAVPWDARIRCAHFNVPTFGHQSLRLILPTTGSAAALQRYYQHHPQIFETLAYYDAAISAGFARQPAHFAAALFDPVVAPPSQFAIYNAWAGEKSLFVLDAGHFEYPRRLIQDQRLITEIVQFVGDKLS